MFLAKWGCNTIVTNVLIFARILNTEVAQLSID